MYVQVAILGYQCANFLMLPWLLFLSTYIIDTRAKLIQLNWSKCCYFNLQNLEVIEDNYLIFAAIFRWYDLIISPRFDLLSSPIYRFH